MTRRRTNLRQDRGGRGRAGFTLIEIVLAIVLAGLVMVALNTFVFSMGELWGKNQDLRLFDQHVRAVTRFLEEELRTAAFPPAVPPGGSAIKAEEVRPQSGATENLLTFELPAGSRLIAWPDRPLPEVVCALHLKENEGLRLLWRSRLETRFDDDPPRETLISPLVTGLSYEYYDPNFRNWKKESQLQRNSDNELLAPERIRLTFTHGRMTRERVITLPSVPAGLPNF